MTTNTTQIKPELQLADAVLETLTDPNLYDAIDALDLFVAMAPGHFRPAVVEGARVEIRNRFAK